MSRRDYIIRPRHREAFDGVEKFCYLLKHMNRILSVTLCLFCALAGAQEKEPNNQANQATPIEFGKPVKGIVHANDGQDHFTLTAPGPGTITVTLSNAPAECRFQVGALGFQKDTASSLGWEDSVAGKPFQWSFPAKGNCAGYVWVQPAGILSSASLGDNMFVLCHKDGPWHVRPYPDRPPANVPKTFENLPVAGPIEYTLVVTFLPEGGVAPPPTASQPVAETIEPFPDERAAMEKGDLKALAAIRVRYALALAEEADRTKDHAMFARALLCAEGACAALPRDPQLRMTAARLYMRLPNDLMSLTLAEEHLRKAAILEARLLLAQNLFYQRRFSAAAAEFQAVLEKQPSLLKPSVAAMLGNCYVLDQAPQKGEAVFRALLQRQPGSPPARAVLALLLYQQGKLNDALALVRQLNADKQTPADWRAYAGKLADAWQKEARQ